MFRFAQGSIQHHRVFNGDPHPGNYRFHEDGTVTFLDFGLVKRWGPGELESLSDVLDRILDDDVDGAISAAIDAGFLPADHGLDPRHIFEYVSGPYEPFMADEFTYSRDWTGEGAAEGRRHQRRLRRRHPGAEHADVVRDPRSGGVGHVGTARPVGGDEPLGRPPRRVPQGRPAGDGAREGRGGVAQLTPLRAVAGYLRKYPLAPRYPRRTAVRLTAGDGTRLAAHRVAGPADAPCTVVLAHGFVNSTRTPALHAFAHTLADTVDVIVLDLRGHGRSGGVCTFGRDEPLDIAAAVAAADSTRPVVTLGVSLGGAAVLLHASRDPGTVAGVVAISAPVRWGGLGTAGAARIEQWVATTRGRLVLRLLLGTRVSAEVPAPAGAAEALAAISPGFTIVIADPDDWYFGPEHAEQLHAWAQEPKALWWYPGGGHGTDLLTTALAARLLSSIEEHLRGRGSARASGVAPDGA